MKTKGNPPEGGAGAVDRSWHLARNPLEVDVAELEYALMRAFEVGRASASPR
jgi:predicted MarR family transcription regulator